MSSEENSAIIEMFEQMKDKELKARELYTQALELTLDEEILKQLKQLIKDEAKHYKNTLDILKILKE